MAWSIDNPVIGEFEDLPVQPLPYRMTFIPAEPPSVTESIPSHAPTDFAPTPSDALTSTDANVSLPTRWSPENPVVGEFEDLIPQPLPCRTIFLAVDQPAESVSLPTAELAPSTAFTMPASCASLPAEPAPPHAMSLLSPFSGLLVLVADGFQPSAGADDELTLPYLISSTPLLSGRSHTTRQPATLPGDQK